MKKETNISRMWRKATLAAAAVCVSAGLANAAVPFPNGGTIEANVEYEIGIGDFSATFIPSTSGTVMHTVANYIHPYYDANHTNMVPDSEDKLQNYNDLGTKSLTVTKGTPVYFSGFLTKYDYQPGVTFKITENAPIKINGYSIQPNSVLSTTSGYDDLLVYANQPVRAQGATLTIDKSGTSQSISTSSEYATTLSFNYVKILNNWFNTKALEGGEALTLTIRGIVNNAGVLYNGGQDLVLHYKAPQKTTTLRSVVYPDPFNSFWPEGDPGAVLTAVYSDKITKAEYHLTFGNFEQEIPDGYYEWGSSNNPNSEAKITIEGNTVKVDFSGKQRRPQDMVPSGTNYNNLVVKIIAWDADGEYVAGSGQGQVGSFDHLLNYKYITPAEFNTTFTPDKGESIKGVNDVKVELYDFDKINFTGVKFEIEGGETIIVPKSEVTITNGAANMTQLTIPVPAAVKNTSERVVVTLDGLTSLDGIDHTNDLRVVYNGFTITTFELFTPPPAEQIISAKTLSGLEAGTRIDVLTNISEEYPDLYMTYRIENIYNGETTIEVNSFLNRISDFGEVVYTNELMQNVKMLRNHEYRFVFTAYETEMDFNYGNAPIGSEYFTYFGSAEPFRFSSIELESVNPENGTEIDPTQTQFVLKYNGLVQLSSATSYINAGQGQTVPFESIVATEDEGGYANEWTVTIPDSYIATSGITSLDLTIVATDEEGLLVQGNEGEEESNYLWLNYPIYGAGLNSDFYVTPAEGVVEELLAFEIGCDSFDTSLTYNSDLAMTLTVLRDEREYETLYTITADDCEVVPVPKPGVEIPEGTEDTNSDYYTTVVRFSLVAPITEDGLYSLNIPQGFFEFGSQFTTTVNEVRAIGYQIGGGASLIDYTAVPEPGTVTELSQVKIHFDAASEGAGRPQLSINNGTPIDLDYQTTLSDDYFEVWMDLEINMPQTYTENGTYEVILPDGFILDEFGDSVGKITLTYIIGTNGIDAIFGNETSVNVYTVDGHQLVKNGNADDVKALSRGMYIINGKKIVLM